MKRCFILLILLLATFELRADLHQRVIPETTSATRQFLTNDTLPQLRAFLQIGTNIYAFNPSQLINSTNFVSIIPGAPLTNVVLLNATLYAPSGQPTFTVSNGIVIFGNGSKLAMDGQGVTATMTVNSNTVVRNTDSLNEGNFKGGGTQDSNTFATLGVVTNISAVTATNVTTGVGDGRYIGISSGTGNTTTLNSPRIQSSLTVGNTSPLTSTAWFYAHQIRDFTTLGVQDTQPNGSIAGYDILSATSDHELAIGMQNGASSYFGDQNVFVHVNPRSSSIPHAKGISYGFEDYPGGIFTTHNWFWLDGTNGSIDFFAPLANGDASGQGNLWSGPRALHIDGTLGVTRLETQSPAQITGTGTYAASANVLTGTGTAFFSELQIGSIIYDSNNVALIVLATNSNTSAKVMPTVSGSYTASAGMPFSVQQPSIVASGIGPAPTGRASVMPSGGLLFANDNDNNTDVFLTRNKGAQVYTIEAGNGQLNFGAWGNLGQSPANPLYMQSGAPDSTLGLRANGEVWLEQGKAKVLVDGSLTSTGTTNTLPNQTLTGDSSVLTRGLADARYVTGSSASFVSSSGGNATNLTHWGSSTFGLTSTTLFDGGVTFSSSTTPLFGDGLNFSSGTKLKGFLDGTLHYGLFLIPQMDSSTYTLNLGAVVVTNGVTAATFSGSGASLTSLNGANITTGTINSNKLDAATQALLGGSSGNPNAITNNDTRANALVNTLTLAPSNNFNAITVTPLSPGTNTGNFNFLAGGSSFNSRFDNVFSWGWNNTQGGNAADPTKVGSWWTMENDYWGNGLFPPHQMELYYSVYYPPYGGPLRVWGITHVYDSTNYSIVEGGILTSVQYLYPPGTNGNNASWLNLQPSSYRFGDANGTNYFGWTIDNPTPGTVQFGGNTTNGYLNYLWGYCNSFNILMATGGGQYSFATNTCTIPAVINAAAGANITGSVNLTGALGMVGGALTITSNRIVFNGNSDDGNMQPGIKWQDVASNAGVRNINQVLNWSGTQEELEYSLSTARLGSSYGNKFATIGPRGFTASGTNGFYFASGNGADGTTMGPSWTSGSGTPEGAVTKPVGSLYTRTDGGANTTLYVKESGSGNTGWVAK